MKYTTRKGIVLADICGEYLLVAGKEARSYCPYSVQLNESAALIYRLIDAGLNEKEIKKELLNEYKMDDQTDIDEVISECTQQFVDMGYIIQGG